MVKKKATKKVNISAITGKYVTQSEVEKHPKTTVTMTVKVPKKTKKKD